MEATAVSGRRFPQTNVARVRRSDERVEDNRDRVNANEK